MPKAGELNWDELYKSADDEYKHNPTALWSAKPGCGVDPLNKAEKLIKDGEEPYRPSDAEIAEYILRGIQNGPQGQWKDEDHLHREVVSEAQAQQLQKNWENAIQGFYEAANSPISPDEQDIEWGSGKSFNETLSEEERLKRNMYTGD